MRESASVGYKPTQAAASVMAAEHDSSNCHNWLESLYKHYTIHISIVVIISVSDVIVDVTLVMTDVDVNVLIVVMTDVDVLIVVIRYRPAGRHGHRFADASC